MFTKEQLLQIIPDVPNEFSIEDLFAILNRPLAERAIASTSRPIHLTPAETAEWERYTAPEAMALYAKFAMAPEVAALRGIAASLPPTDLKKSAKEWEAERLQEKYEA